MTNAWDLRLLKRPMNSIRCGNFNFFRTGGSELGPSAKNDGLKQALLCADSCVVRWRCITDLSPLSKSLAFVKRTIYAALHLLTP